MTGDLHIEPRAASNAVRFLESMRNRYEAALKGTPILGGRAHQYANRTGINARAHGAEPGARSARKERQSNTEGSRAP